MPVVTASALPAGAGEASQRAGEGRLNGALSPLPPPPVAPSPGKVSARHAAMDVGAGLGWFGAPAGTVAASGGSLSPGATGGGAAVSGMPGPAAADAASAHSLSLSGAVSPASAQLRAVATAMERSPAVPPLPMVAPAKAPRSTRPRLQQSVDLDRSYDSEVDMWGAEQAPAAGPASLYSHRIGMTPDGHFVSPSLPGLSLDTDPFPFHGLALSGGGAGPSKSSGPFSARATPSRAAGTSASPARVPLESARASPLGSIERLPRSYSTAMMSHRITVYDDDPHAPAAGPGPAAGHSGHSGRGVALAVPVSPSEPPAALVFVGPVGGGGSSAGGTGASIGAVAGLGSGSSSAADVSGGGGGSGGGSRGSTAAPIRPRMVPVHLGNSIGYDVSAADDGVLGDIDAHASGPGYQSSGGCSPAFVVSDSNEALLELGKPSGSSSPPATRLRGQSTHGSVAPGATLPADADAGLFPVTQSVEVAVVAGAAPLGLAAAPSAALPGPAGQRSLAVARGDGQPPSFGDDRF
jgi:hypothetical protein